MATRIYTRTGDSGEASLFGGARVPKDNARLEAFGALDELNAFLGLARAHQPDPDLDAILKTVQNDLFSIGAELATPATGGETRGSVTIRAFGDERFPVLEQSIDSIEELLEPLTRFILPGGTPFAASLHVARTVCRRAERRCVSLSVAENNVGRAPVSAAILAYINRLSDLLFVMARAANQRAGASDVPWENENP